VAFDGRVPDLTTILGGRLRGSDRCWPPGRPASGDQFRSFVAEHLPGNRVHPGRPSGPRSPSFRDTATSAGRLPQTRRPAKSAFVPPDPDGTPHSRRGRPLANNRRTDELTDRRLRTNEDDCTISFSDRVRGRSDYTGYTLIERLGIGGFGEVGKPSPHRRHLQGIKIHHWDRSRTNTTTTVSIREQELTALKGHAVRHPTMLSPPTSTGTTTPSTDDGSCHDELADWGQNLWTASVWAHHGYVVIPRDERSAHPSNRPVLDPDELRLALHTWTSTPTLSCAQPRKVGGIRTGEKTSRCGGAQVTGGISTPGLPLNASPETFRRGSCPRSATQYKAFRAWIRVAPRPRPFELHPHAQLLMSIT